MTYLCESLAIKKVRKAKLWAQFCYLPCLAFFCFLSSHFDFHVCVRSARPHVFWCKHEPIR